MKRKKAIIISFFVGILTTIVAFTGIAFATQGQSNNSITLKDIRSMKRLESLINDLYYEKTDDVDLVTGMKKGMVESLRDNYSHYLTKEEYKQSLEMAQGSFVGIGVYISATDDNKIIVIAPVKGSPAEKAGIKSGDKIIAVDGKQYEGKTLQEASNAMRGEKGKEVKVTIIDSKNATRILSIIRDDIKTPSVFFEELKDNKNIGYISITSFDEDTGKEFRKELEKLKKKNKKALILDLRSNPGGMVEQVIDVADQILKKEVIFYTNNKKNEKEVFTAKTDECLDMPIVVLVNEHSASAAEILSGALQDNKKATIIGQNTFGKGLVQSLFQIDNDDALVITIAQYFTPKGNTVNKKGIKPDIEVLTMENTAIKDAQLEKAIEYLKNEKNI